MLEASADGGALKTERKGVSLYDVRVVGPRRARRPGARARRQRDPRARPPGARGRGARRPGARHHRHADRAPGRAPRPTPCRPRASFAVDVRVRDRRRAGPGRRGDARAAPGAAGRGRRGDRRAQPAAAGGRVVGRAVRAGARARRTARPAGARRRPRSAAPPTATSPPASARPRSTASAPSAAARTPTTSTSWSTSCPAGPRCSRALIERRCLARPTNPARHVWCGATMTTPTSAAAWTS